MKTVHAFTISADASSYPTVAETVRIWTQVVLEYIIVSGNCAHLTVCTWQALGCVQHIANNGHLNTD